MSAHLLRELENLKRRALSVGGMVEDAIAKAVQAMLHRDARLASDIIRADAEIDQTEVEVEEECLKLLALYQPVAADLRFIVAVLKMNGDLERMGDLAVNIAKGAVRLAAGEPVEVPGDFATMAAKARSMITRSLDAVVNADPVLAAKVCADDDEVDDMKRSMCDIIQGEMGSSRERDESLLTIFMAVSHLERLADMATNIAEDVVYMVKGRIVRHQGPARAK